MRMLIGAVALVGLLQAGPVILSSDDIGDNYYDGPPAVILARATWLGLFIKEGMSDQKTRESHLAVTSVSFALGKEPGPHCVSAGHQSAWRGPSAVWGVAALAGPSYYTGRSSRSRRGHP